MSALSVDLVIEDEEWEADIPDAAAIAERAALATYAAASEPESGAAVVTIALADDATLRDLNREWRGKDKPTNVLSFPSGDEITPGGPVFLGDVILARQTLLREANDQEKPNQSHLAHLVVHGILHLMGWDHETPDDAQEMETLEREILLGLGIPDPYLIGADKLDGSR